MVWLYCLWRVGFFKVFFVSNEAVEASSRRRENKHLGGKIFKNIVFLYNNIYFSSKMWCVTVFIYVFIILIFYWFLNHFCICCMCNFVRYEAVNSTVSESFLYVGDSFPRQNFHFDCTCGEFLDMEKVYFSLKINEASKQSPKYQDQNSIP